MAGSYLTSSAMKKTNLVSQWPKFILKITIAWHNMKRSFDQRKNINQSCKMGEDWRTVFPLNYWYVLGVEAKLHDWAERPVSSALASRSEKEPSKPRLWQATAVSWNFMLQNGASSVTT